MQDIQIIMHMDLFFYPSWCGLCDILVMLSYDLRVLEKELGLSLMYAYSSHAAIVWCVFTKYCWTTSHGDRQTVIFGRMGAQEWSIDHQWVLCFQMFTCNDTHACKYFCAPGVTI
jgi:hypothetical protein